MQIGHSDRVDIPTHSRFFSKPGARVDGSARGWLTTTIAADGPTTNCVKKIPVVRRISKDWKQTPRQLELLVGEGRCWWGLVVCWQPPVLLAATNI